MHCLMSECVEKQLEMLSLMCYLEYWHIHWWAKTLGPPLEAWFGTKEGAKKGFDE